MALNSEIMPEKTNPNMEWYDACIVAADDWETIRKKIDDYLIAHQAFLPQSVLNEVNHVAVLCTDSYFESHFVDDEFGKDSLKKDYGEKILEGIKGAKKELGKSISQSVNKIFQDQITPPPPKSPA